MTNREEQQLYLKRITGRCEVKECIDNVSAVVTLLNANSRVGMQDVRMCETHLAHLLNRLSASGLYVFPGTGETYRVWWRALFVL